MFFSLYRHTNTQTQTAVKKREMTSSIYSLVRIWKIRHSGPGCSFVWILWVVYFPVKHSCIIIIIISISVLLRYNIFENNQVIMATTRLLMTLVCLFTAFTSKEWLVTNKISLIWASLTEFLYTLLLPTTKFELFCDSENSDNFTSLEGNQTNRLNVLTSWSPFFFENSIYTWCANV